MGERAWICSALITGIWAAIHVFVFLDATSIFEQSAAAVIFTLSLIATLFFACKASEAPEEGEEEERKESEAKNKEMKKVKDGIF